MRILSGVSWILWLFAGAAVAQPAGISPVTVRTVWSVESVGPGDQAALAVVLDILPPYHVNPGASQIPPEFDYLIPTSLEVTESPSWLQVGPVQHPAAQLVQVNYTGEPSALNAYAGKTVLYVPVIAGDDADPGRPAELALSLEYQACDEEQCLLPETRQWTVELAVVEKGQGQVADTGDLFASFDASAFAAMRRGEVPLPSLPGIGGNGEEAFVNDFFGWKIRFDPSTWLGLSLVLLVAFLAGILLNFTPCVLPVVPIKVLSLHRQSADPARCLRLGIVFSLGIVATFVALGALVAGLVSGVRKFEWGEIFSHPAFSVTLAVVIIAMALGMLGLFSINLPQRLYRFSPSHDTATGNFLLGVLTAVLSTPCTGPLLGATIAWAIKQHPGLGLGTFVAMGAGMALPYQLLTMNPKWIDRLPRAGPGSELIKQVMGLLLLAVAAFFLGPVIPKAYEWWLIAVLIVSTMVFLVIRTFGISRRLGVRISTVTLAVVLAGSSVALAQLLNAAGPIPWREYSPDAVEDARAAGQTVLLEFTADWCGNCKALELTVYRDRRLAALFSDERYVAFQVDLTSSGNTEGWRLQRRLGAGGGIPLAAIYTPGREEPVEIFQGLFTADQLLGALER